MPPWGRSSDDLLILYTGGTTGMPKGVMWRQEDLFFVLGGGGQLLPRHAAGLAPGGRGRAGAGRHRRRRSGQRTSDHPRRGAADAWHQPVHRHHRPHCRRRVRHACPRRGHFDSNELWSEVERLRVNAISIVGMAFAQPMLAALDANPSRWDLSSLRRIGSSGTVWSMENKQGLLAPSAGLPDLRQPRLVGGGRHGRLGVRRRRYRRDRKVHGRRPTAPVSPRTAAGSSPARASAACWRSRATCRSATTRIPRRPSAPSRSSKAGAGRCRATGRPSRRTAACSCSAAARR